MVSLSTIPAAVVTVLISAQVVPLSDENCHTPSVLESEASATITMPANVSAEEPPEMVSTLSSNSEENMDEIVAPAGSAVSSSTAVRAPGPVKEGSSFTSPIITPNDTPAPIPSSVDTEPALTVVSVEPEVKPLVYTLSIG